MAVLPNFVRSIHRLLQGHLEQGGLVAANPSEIPSQFRNITVCGTGGASNLPSGGGNSRVDLVLHSNVRLAGVESLRSGSENSGWNPSKMDRRSKFRATKQAARLAAKGFKAVDDKLKIIDAPLIIGCVIVGLVLVWGR
jgi:hypothetical protein